jgi:hypothetical protein
MDFKKLKFRSSGVGHIMPSLDTITEKQLETLAGLLVKEKLTDNQRETLTELIKKRDTKPELTKGIVTHLYDLYDSFVNGIYEDIDNKFTIKGNLCEQDSLALLSEVAGIFLIKNKNSFSNAWIQGTPDCLHREFVIDVKTSWNLRTFRAAELSTLYYWQLMSYMWLTGAKRGLLAYCLVDTPMHMVYDAQRKALWNANIIDEGSDEAQPIMSQIERNMTYSDRIDAKNRVKVFIVERNESEIKEIKNRVNMCRKKLVEIHKLEVSYRPELSFLKPQKK